MTSTAFPVPSFTPGCPVVIAEKVRIPPGITDHDSFRRWVFADASLDKIHLAYLNGVIWVDPTMEQWLTHNQIKGEVNTVLGGMLKDTQQGRYSPDGMVLSNTAVRLTTIPDGLFASFDTLRSGRLRRIASARNVGVVELEGTPDMVLEVVSESSVEKDTVVLPPLYQAAGIAEFWRIDARGELKFEVFRLTATGYVLTTLSDGWSRSDVFHRDFRLIQGADVLGDALYVLEVRAITP